MNIDIAATDITPLYLDSLGIISSLTKELGIADKIDAKLYNNDKRRKVTPGKAVEAMILNTLGFSERALYLTPNFYRSKPVSQLLGNNIKSEDLNDNTLGHALDEIDEYGSTKLFSEIVFEIALEKDLLNNINNVDTTTFSFHGNYNNKEDDDLDSDETARVNITHGYSKDKRPDLKQVTLSMVMNNKLNIPIFIESLNGNSSDKKSLQETIERVEKFTSNIDLQKPFTWIADSALYNKNRLLKTNNFVWLTRIPNTLAESKKFLSTPYSSLEWQKTESDYEYTEKTSNYGGVKQKWLMYYSPQKYEIDKSKFKERFSKEEELLKTLRAKYESKSYSTEAICKSNETKIKESSKYHSITTEIKKSEKRYKIKIKIKVKEEVIELKKRSFGRFILGTNDVNECHYKSTSILDLYKSQQNIERGFRFLKDPYFMSDIFYLKKEERISSLLMIMTMTLLVYNYGQEKLNKNLKNTSSTLPNQKRKEKSRVTLKWVFKLMSGISVLQIKQGSNKEEKMSKISDLQKKIIRMLCEKDNVYDLPTVDTS